MNGDIKRLCYIICERNKLLQIRTLYRLRLNYYKNLLIAKKHYDNDNIFSPVPKKWKKAPLYQLKEKVRYYQFKKAEAEYHISLHVSITTKEMRQELKALGLRQKRNADNVISGLFNSKHKTQYTYHDIDVFAKDYEFYKMTEQQLDN